MSFGDPALSNTLWMIQGILGIILVLLVAIAICKSGDNNSSDVNDEKDSLKSPLLEDHEK